MTGGRVNDRENCMQSSTMDAQSLRWISPRNLESCLNWFGSRWSPAAIAAPRSLPGSLNCRILRYGIIWPATSTIECVWSTIVSQTDMPCRLWTQLETNCSQKSACTSPTGKLTWACKNAPVASTTSRRGMHGSLWELGTAQNCRYSIIKLGICRIRCVASWFWQ